MTNNIIQFNKKYEDNTKEIKTLFEEFKRESGKAQYDSFEFFKFMLTYSTRAKQLLVFENTPQESDELKEVKLKFRKEFELLTHLLDGRNLHSELSLTVMHLTSIETEGYLTEQAKKERMTSLKRTLSRLEARCKLDKSKKLELEKIKELKQWYNNLKEETK